MRTVPPHFGFAFEVARGSVGPGARRYDTRHGRPDGASRSRLRDFQPEDEVERTRRGGGWGTRDGLKRTGLLQVLRTK